MMGHLMIMGHPYLASQRKFMLSRERGGGCFRNVLNLCGMSREGEDVFTIFPVEGVSFLEQPNLRFVYSSRTKLSGWRCPCLQLH